MKQMNLLKNMAATLLLAVGMVACSQGDDMIANNQSQPVEAKAQIITVNMGGNDELTRGVDANGQKSITVGEKMSVLYNWNPPTYNGNSLVGGGYYARTAEAEVIAVDATGKIATLSVSLPNAYTNDEEFALIYPAGWFSENGNQRWTYSNSQLMSFKLGAQDGTLATLSSTLDYCMATGNIENDALPASVTMTNQLCICKFTLQDISDNSDITSAITSFQISAGTESYSITRSAAAGPIYVAMLPETAAAFSFTATDGTNVYKKTVASATLAAGKLYTSTLKLTKQVSNVGKVLGVDGNIYATVAEAEAASTTAAGMIAYEGTETGVDGKTNGLCISLIEGAAEKQLYANISYTAFPARPTGASDWATPSVMQWMRMFEACGGSSIGTKTESSTGSFGSGNIETMMTTCGGAGFHTESGSTYWTTKDWGTDPSYSYRTQYNFYAHGFYQTGRDTGECYYRGVFAW